MSDPIILLDQNKTTKLTGIPRSTMNDWERSGVFIPSPHTKRSRGQLSRWYSFRDIVSLSALRRLRTHGNVSLSEIRRAGEYFSHWYQEPWSELRVGYLSGRLVFMNPITHRWEGVDGQQVIQEIMLSDIPQEVERELPKLLARQSSDFGRVDQSRGVNGSKPTFAGTRIMVDSVRNMVIHGYSDERILQEFPALVPEDIDVVRLEMNQAAS
ncbi:MAG: DUF433 domain-containing protein [Thermomicrobiales bacterium]|nr:DUF433 domain-containing protein [Thermomicrobiales bacterium]